jgi:phosphotransferase system  glucose/maltose/N-acetylglucosamine-specific IIC component
MAPDDRCTSGLWVTLVGAVFVLAYSFVGYLMVGSFAVSNPERLASYQTGAWVYLGLMTTALVTVIGAAVYLVRRRRRE